MMKKSEAETALAALKGRKESKVGETLQMINLGGADNEEAMKGDELEEAKEEEKVETYPKPVPAEKADVVVRTKKVEKTETVEQELLSRGVENIAVGGIAQFHQTNSKILEIVTMNNSLLLERVREVEENCSKQMKDKDDQIKRLQNLLSNKDDHMRKLTNRLNSATDFEGKVKKFFGENEDFHKKKVSELTKANTELA